MINLPLIAVRIINSLSVVIATLFFTSVLLRLTINRVFALFEEPEERIFYSKIYSWSVYSIGLFFILHWFGVSLGNITLVVGLMATGLAFAVRDVLLSFFGWMILLRKKPFRIGEYIRIGEDEGKVMHIGTFYVLLDSTSNLPEDYTRVPNRLFLEKSITILGKKHFLDQIQLQLSGIPDNKPERLALLQEHIRTMLDANDYLMVYVDLKNDRLYLIIEYLVDIEKKKIVRSSIIDACFISWQNHILLPK